MILGTTHYIQSEMEEKKHTEERDAEILHNRSPKGWGWGLKNR